MFKWGHSNNATFILETRYDLFFQPSWYFSTHDLFIIAQALSSCWQTTASATHYALMMMYLTRKENFFCKYNLRASGKSQYVSRVVKYSKKSLQVLTTFFSVGSWIMWFFSCRERKICLESWAESQNDSYIH